MADHMKPRVYFYCRDNPHAYQDDVVVLAEGLRELGIGVTGNCRYWRRSPNRDDWLIQPDPQIGPDECDVVAVSYCWSRWMDSDFRVYESPLPEGLFKPGRRYRTAYLDLDDGYATCSWRPEYRQFDVVLRAKYNCRCFHPANHRPWALSLTARVLQATTAGLPWAERRRELLVNFNASHPYIHQTRALMEKWFTPEAARHFTINRDHDNLRVPPTDPYDRLMWEQTQRRHSRAYYERLCTAQAVAAFCGELIPPLPFQPDYLVGGRRALLKRRFYQLLGCIDPRPPRLIQWDSWRFWEAMAAGCLVFNLDLPHYGVQLPVMPENFVHYVGVRADNVGSAFARLDRDSGLAARIAAQGQAWALEHYSPKAMAQRFLAEVGTSVS
jgi:hypothetical protein